MYYGEVKNELQENGELNYKELFKLDVFALGLGIFLYPKPLFFIRSSEMRR